MNDSNTDPNLTLETVQEQFEKWRSNRTEKRDPIPMICGSLRRHCVKSFHCNVSRRLRLSYIELKKRVTLKPEAGSVHGTRPEQPCRRMATRMPSSRRGQTEAVRSWAASCYRPAAAVSVMIQVTPHMRIVVAVEPVDFRKGIDGLAAVCREKLKAIPFPAPCLLHQQVPKSHPGDRLRRSGVLALPQASFERAVCLEF